MNITPAQAAFWQSFLASQPQGSTLPAAPSYIGPFGNNQELADELVGGILSAGPDRLTAAGRAGVLSRAPMSLNNGGSGAPANDTPVPASGLASHTPERSGVPSAVFGAGAERLGWPSGRRGTPGVGYRNHCA